MMIVTLQTWRLRSIGQVRAFVEGNGSVDYEHRDRKSAHAFVGDRLRRFGCKGLGKRDKGTVRRFLAKTTGLSEAQVDRLIRQWRETGRIEDRRGGGRGRPFERRYTAADIRVLADVDEQCAKRKWPWCGTCISVTIGGALLLSQPDAHNPCGA